jgi:hypothetical protein
MQSSDWGPARKAVLEPQRDKRMQMNPGVEPLWHQIPAQLVFFIIPEKNYLTRNSYGLKCYFSIERACWEHKTVLGTVCLIQSLESFVRCVPLRQQVFDRTVNASCQGQRNRK